MYVHTCSRYIYTYQASYTSCVGMGRQVEKGAGQVDYKLWGILKPKSQPLKNAI